ncbi:MAG: hypothetical protein ACI4EH_05025 [Oliverpabstia sp.]
MTFSQGRYKTRIRRLAAEHPEECEIVAENKDGSLCAHIPVAWIKIFPPKQFTDEQRQEMGNRLNGRYLEIPVHKERKRVKIDLNCFWVELARKGF